MLSSPTGNAILTLMLVMIPMSILLSATLVGSGNRLPTALAVTLGTLVVALAAIAWATSLVHSAD